MQLVSFRPRRSWKASVSVMAVKRPRSLATSMVSRSKVRSVPMLLRSCQAITGLSSMPLALRHSTGPCSPSSRCIRSMGTSCRVWIRITPMLRSRCAVLPPTPGMRSMGMGARKGFSVPRGTCSSPKPCLASPVATLLTVLLMLSPMLLGRPVSLAIRCRSSVASFQLPKKRSVPLRST